jgi:hypothetical protein
MNDPRAAALRAAAAEAEAQQAQLWRTAQNDAARLAAADKARDDGKIKVAARLYLRLAKSRPANPSTESARAALAELAAEANRKLDEIDKRLEEGRPSPGELLRADDRRDRSAHTQWAQTVRGAFDQYHRLVQDYEVLPAVANKLKGHVSSQRHRPDIALVLNEPEAQGLWKAGQQHEAEGHRCCAYWVYRRAAQLVPAPSAERARRRLAEWEGDGELLKAAEICREVQQCHNLYLRAQRISQADPARAQELLSEIVRRAPEDSQIHRTAQSDLAKTTRPE